MNESNPPTTRRPATRPAGGVCPPRWEATHRRLDRRGFRGVVPNSGMSRRDIHYWKCDRPAAFHGTQPRGDADGQIARQLQAELQRHFDTGDVVLRPGAGEGNHLTWSVDLHGQPLFVRVENGPEQDTHLAVESALLDRVRAAGVTTPRVLGCDVSRRRVPFAWQALERKAASDLNAWFQQGTLQVPKVAYDIGVAVATWQSIQFGGFGVLEFGGVDGQGDSKAPGARFPGSLEGPHRRYADYFHLRLDQHMHFLVERGFLANADEIRAEIENHRALLDLPQGCLVHKDLALWNILGSRDEIAAFIDFDDSISGDPMDDLSLLACFHDALFLQRALEGYQSVRPLPDDHRRRLWLHLLRNMIVKSVIRVGAGYFDRGAGFFLLGPGLRGADLERMTRQRLATALDGLRADAETTIL